MIRFSFVGDTHPSNDQLADFGRGEIDDLLAEAIEAHLADCIACSQRLEVIGFEDPWLTLLRRVGPTPPMSVDSPGVSVGYELLAVIGRGGMGVVHRARQVGLDRPVALKMIATGRDASPNLVDRFRREIEAAASLNHPAIVQIHDVGTRDDTPFFTMELLEGGSLADRLANGPLAIPESVALVERLARAVDFAHRRRIIHRDLKPSNILFDNHGDAKVADFGLAKRLDADTLAATNSSVLLGTPAYMSPEQVAGNTEAVGPATDVHALGAILYECITGRPPYVASTPLETLELIKSAEPPNPSRFRSNLPTDLATICLTCLEKTPGRRYVSAAALADDLGRFARGETILARPASKLDHVTKWARRRPAEAALAVLFVLSLAGTIVGLLVHQSRLTAALKREADAANDANSQRGIAVANYREARDAITKILATLSDPKYAGSPRLSEVYRSQAEAALTFYDRVLGQTDSPNPMILRDTAKAAVEAANLQITLGRPELAEPNLLRAQRLYENLLDLNPDDRDLLRDQMVAYIKMGVSQVNRKSARSIAAYERALALARRRFDLGKSSDNRIELDLAWCEHNLGSAFQLTNQPKLAVPHYAQAVAVYEQALRNTPDDASLLVELAQSLINLGQVHATTHDNTKAETNFREADGMLGKALTAKPGVTEYVASRCDLFINWGNLDVEMGRVDAAIERFGDGLRALLPILNAEPNVLRLKVTARNLHGARALALERNGRFVEAVKDWSQVIAFDEPGPVMTSHAINRLAVMARGGDYRTVATEALSFESLADLPATDRYMLGCALSLAIAAAPVDSPERSNLRSRALKAMKQAFAKEPGLVVSARQDADLKPLADDQIFRQLIDSR
jgi:serine/threonine protein kinase